MGAMGEKYDKVMASNRRRIAGLAVAGLLDYWVAALLFVLAVTVGALVAFLVQGIVNGGDFSLLWKGVRAIPEGVAWAVDAGWLSSASMTWAAVGFVVVGTVAAVVLMWGRLRAFDRLLPRRPGAVPDKTAEPVLEAVALAAGVAVPHLEVLLDPALNSCSVGRKPDDAVIVLTTGLVGALTRDELEAVLAYELSRVSSFDTALSTWTAAITGRTIELYETTDRILVKLALIVPARLARRLRARTIRRQAGQRDILALSFTRYPEALLSALEKIDRDMQSVTALGPATAPLWLKWPWRDARESGRIPSLNDRISELRALVAA